MSKWLIKEPLNEQFDAANSNDLRTCFKEEVLKYNIVLIPNSGEVSQALIDLANQIIVENSLKPDYLLKDTKQLSIPHISVVQFERKTIDKYGDDNQFLLESIWKEIVETWQEILGDLQELICTLPQTINYKHDTLGLFAGVSWSEIIINKTKNPLMQQFHDKLCKRLELLGIKSLNASGEHYNPHITLFNFRTSLYEKNPLVKEIPESYFLIIKSFSLKPALGVANNNWEFTMKLKEEKTPKLLREKMCHI